VVTSKAKTVAAYLKTLDPDDREGIEYFRRIVKQAAPTAIESMKHGMPTYARADGTSFVAFSAQKHYLAFYIGERFVTANRTRLEKRNVLGRLTCGKGCIRGRRIDPFVLSDSLLEKLVKQAAKHRPKPGVGKGDIC